MSERSVLKTSLKVWLRLAFASFLCLIVWASIYAMSTALFADVVGYRVYELDESGEHNRLVTEHYYTEGEDVNAKIPLKEGQSVYTIRQTSKTAARNTGIISSIFTLIIFGSFPYNMLWNIGSKERNYVNFERLDKDILFGLKVGVIATIPSALLYILLVLGKLGVLSDAIIRWHRIINTPYIPYIDAVEGGVKVASELSVTSLLAVAVPLLFVPLVCSVGYILGYRQISVRERLVYKKSKSEQE